MTWLLLWALLLPVDGANALAAELVGSDSPACERQWRKPYGCPERVRESLDAISDRELPQEARRRARWFGVHRGDAGHERALEAKGWRRGILSEACPWHGGAEGMSTVGPHGLMYVLNVGRLGVPANCVPWQALGLPIVSALAAGQRYLALCREPGGWCPSAGARVRARKRRS